MKQPKSPEQLFVFAGSFIFFCCTLAANFSAPHDSIGYLNGIISGEHLGHPHHLLYHFSAHYWLMATQYLFPGIKDYYLVEVFTALCGSGCITIVFAFFRRRFGLSMPVALLNTSVIVFTYGVWFYSVNIEVYASSMVLVLWALYLLTRPGFGKGDVWKVAVLHALAILYGEFHILLTVVILYKLWKERQRLGFLPALATYAGIGIVLVGGMYYWLGWYVEGHNSLAEWTGWIKGYTTHANYWHPLGLQTPVSVATGFTHAFIGGHFLLEIPGVSDAIDQSLAAHSLADEAFLARHIDGVTAILLTVLTIFLAACMLLLVVRFIRKYKTLRSRFGTVTSPLLICGLAYTAFFCVWEPEILEFWIFQTILFWLLMLGTLPATGFPFRLPALGGTVALSASLLLVNYFGSIRWLRDLEHDLYYVEVRPLEKTATGKDLILQHKEWVFKDFLVYFTRADVQNTPAADSARAAVDQAVSASLSAGGKVYLYPGDPHNTGSYETRYIDSLLNVYKDRAGFFREADPVIIRIGN